MDRIVILGGGVGGTLTANLLAKRLRKQIEAGAVEVLVIDSTGEHVYQPGFMYIAMGGERAAKLHRPERSLLDPVADRAASSSVASFQSARSRGLRMSQPALDNRSGWRGPQPGRSAEA